MGKSTQKERAQKYLGRNSGVSEVFGTSDGFLFEKRADARNHAKTLDSKELKRYTKTDVEEEGVDENIVNASEFLKASVKTIKEELPDMKDVKELQSYLEEEKNSPEPRVTAIEAIENRIEELNGEGK